MGHSSKTSVELIMHHFGLQFIAVLQGRRGGVWCWIFCLLKSVVIPSLLFVQFHQSLFFTNLGDSFCNSLGVACSQLSSGDMSVRWQLTSYNPNHWLFSHRTRSPGSKLWTSLSSHITHQVIPRSLSKSNPMGEFVIAWCRNNSDCFLQHLSCVH